VFGDIDVNNRFLYSEKDTTIRDFDPFAKIKVMEGEFRLGVLNIFVA
jgi:hypothetical protein